MAPITLEFDDRPVRDHTVSSLLETRAAWVGDEPCLYYGHDDSEYTYDEVNETANAIANALAGLGVERGQKVSMMIENKLHGVFVMLGAHKAGAVFAPINHEFTGDVLAYQLADVGPSVLVLEDQFIEAYDRVAGELETDPHLVVIETDADTHTGTVDGASGFDDLLDGDRSNPDVDLSWDDTATILYTSGTTGHPKGVVVPYRWICYYSAVRWQVMTRDDVVHTSLPLYHGAAPYWDLAPALVVGAPTALWDRFSPSRFLDRARTYEASVVTLISVMHSWLRDQPERDDDHRNSLNKVQMSPLPDYVGELAERFSFDFVTSKFGQQESGNPLTGFVHAARGADATPEELRRGRPPDSIIERAEALGVPVTTAPGERWIGKPMPWVDVAIVNERDEPLGPGEIGQLAVRPTVPFAMFNGYYNRPEKTLEEVRNLWFHVGDAMYYDEDGEYYFVDRMGHIIRKRGENLSSEQIEEAMNDAPWVAESAALPVEAAEGGEDEIAAVLLLADGGADAFSEAAFRSHIEGRLPEVMWPDRVIVVDDLPMTDTNKVRKHELHQRLFAE